MSDIVNRTDTTVLATVEPSIGEMLQTALGTGTSAEAIKALCDAFVTMDDRKKRQEFQTAYTLAQKEIPPVRKDASRVITAGVKAPYASRTAIQKHLSEHLPTYGLSYSLEQSLDKEGVTVVCEVSHVNGHSKRFPYTEAWGAPGDSKTSKTTTTAIRGALCLAFGLVIRDPEDADDDSSESSEPVSREQLNTLRTGLAETGASEAKLLPILGVQSLEKLPSASFQIAMNLIDAKRKANK